MRALLIACLAFWTISVCAADAPAPPAEPAPADQIAIDGETISINGKSLKLPCDRAEVEAILGKPDREEKLLNTILVWDKRGIVVFVKPDVGKVRQLTVALDKGDFKYWPAHRFPGKLTLDGAEVTAKTDVEELDKARTGDRLKKGPVDTRSGKFKRHTIDHENTIVMLLAADEKVGTKDAKLASVSLDVRYAKPKK